MPDPLDMIEITQDFLREGQPKEEGTLRGLPHFIAPDRHHLVQGANPHAPPEPRNIQESVESSSELMVS